jgi:glycosyltransferase involved in cell wall biosynthesis
MILTDSDFSRRELQHYLGVADHRIRVVPLGSDHLGRISADPSILARYHLGTRPFVLAVSSLAPHKNLGTLIRALGRIRQSHADLDFVLAGARFDRVFGAGLLPESGAVQVGYVSDAELKALYQSAACFVYPSLYEGFGLPPLEAMACGCPVVLSSAGALPEVGGDAVLYFEPHDPVALASAVERVLYEPGLARQLRERARARAAELTWDRCARQTFAVVEEALTQ